MMDERNKQIHAVTQGLRIILKGVQAHSKFVEKSCGMSSAKLWMLHEIAGAPGIKVSRLAAVLSIHPSTCSNMLDKLEEKQLVSRDRSKSDQRTVHLRVTAEGHRLLAKAPKPPQGMLSSALEQLSSAQLASLETGVTALVQALHAADDKAGLIPILGE
jgi:MarR family transcriptional regulator, organic hydroperoxide resistance regulator